MVDLAPQVPRHTVKMPADLSTTLSSAAKSMQSTIQFDVRVNRPRIKRPHYKVKTGCRNCRERRIKCDEERPSCKQCAKSRRVCSGYSATSTFSRGHLVKLETTYNCGTVRIPLAVSSMPSHSLADWRSFQFYFEISQERITRFYVGMMSGLFTDKVARLNAEALNIGFWQTTFPRLVCAQPIVREGLLLITTVHQQLQKTQTPCTTDPESLKLHIATLSNLRHSWNSLTVDTILLVGLELAMADLTAGPSESGLAYLESGQRIIKERRMKPESYCSHPQDSGADDFRQAIELMYEAFCFKVEREQGIQLPEEDDADLSHSDLPSICVHVPFETLEQALGSLETIFRRAQLFMVTFRDEVTQPEIDALHEQAERWWRAFQELAQTLKANARFKGQTALIVIEVHGLIARICADVPRTETDYDKHDSLFEEVSDMANEYLRLNKGITSDDLQSLPWGMGLVNPIFFAATKARNLRTRSSLLRVLSQLHMTEGSWTSCSAYQIALHISRMEHSLGLATKRSSRVTVEDRVRFKSAAFVNEARVTITYTQQHRDRKLSSQTHTFEVKPCEQQNILNKVSSVRGVGEMQLLTGS